MSRYFKSATYHLELIRHTYNGYIPKMKFPKDSPFSAMDVGCGSGRAIFGILQPLLPKNCTELIGTDYDHSMIEHCRSLQTMPNILFEQLDIDSKILPDKFKERFHSIFSSYCLMYSKDLRQALVNSRDMLKKDGELLFMFLYKKNYLYGTYREMSKKDIWKTYTKEYAKFEPYFSGDDPDSQLHSLFAEAGLRVLAHEFKPDIYLHATPNAILEVHKSMDAIYQRIPQEQKQEYLNDFDRIFGEKSGLPTMDKEKLQEIGPFNFPSVIIHAKK